MDEIISREDVYKELYRSEYNNFCQYAFAYVGNDHTAEDIVQTSFMSAWEKRKDLVNYPDVKYFIIAIIRNNCISFLRKQNTNAVIFTEYIPEVETETAHTPLQYEEHYADKLQRVEQALHQLPPKCKEVFLLVKMQGMSYKQAADVLDISVKTVENQMGKALKMIRELVAAAFFMLFTRCIYTVGVIILFALYY